MNGLVLLLILGADSNSVRTEVRVEAVESPDHRGELGAELSRVRGELEALKLVVSRMPEGEARNQELQRLAEFEGLVRSLAESIGSLDAPPSPRPQPQAPTQPPLRVRELKADWPGLLYLGLGLLLGVLFASLAFPGALDSPRPQPNPPGPGRLVFVAGLLAALGLALPGMGYDQDPILLLWAALSAGLLLRLGGLRLGSQMGRILLERGRLPLRSHEQSRPTGSSDHPGGTAPPGSDGASSAD